MHVDIFIAGVGKWYEFKCEEGEKIKNIIRQIYINVMGIEGLSDDGWKQTENKGGKGGIERLIREADLQLACLESKKILDENALLGECPVENGNRLILF